MNKILALLGATLIFISGVAGVGLLDGGAGSAPGAAAATTAGAAIAAVPIQAFTFKPARLTVSVGGRVTWTNLDSTPHTASADQGPAFDTGTLNQGQSKTITFPTAGTFAYHCAFHAFMVATVTVG